MNYSLDVTTDYSLKELNAFLDINSIPDYVKQGEVLSKEAAEKLSEEAFADRYHRAFPIDTPTSTYVSNAYFVNKKAALEEKWGPNFVAEVETRIKQAGELFKISEDLEAYNSGLAIKTAADYTEQCVSSIQADGQIYDLFPYKTAADLIKHAETFAQDIKNYPFSWRAQIASDFVKSATDLGIEEMPDLIAKYAGFYFPDTRNFGTELTRRMNKISSATAKEQYKQCIQKAANIASCQDAMQVCAEAYMIEKSAGVYDNASLSSQLGDIVDKTFLLDIEKIAALLDIVHMDGEPYAMADLKKISKDVYKQAFGCDIDPNNDAELRDVLPTMPGSDVAMLRELSNISSL